MEWALHEAGLDLVDEHLDVDGPMHAVIRGAIPFPATIRAALAEVSIWNDIESARQADFKSYRHGPVGARGAAWSSSSPQIRKPVPSPTRSRADWVHGKLRLGVSGAYDGIAGMSVAEDLKRMAARLQALAENGDSRPAAETVTTSRTG